MADGRAFSVSIWQRGLRINGIAAEALAGGGCSLDAVETALRASEDDTSDMSTGWGGLPNAEGEVELDAAIMLGPGAKSGAVGGLKDTRYAISVARKVMELTPHLLLVGEGAKAFAREHGFEEFRLLTDASRKRWEEWRAQDSAAERGFGSKLPKQPEAGGSGTEAPKQRNGGIPRSARNDNDGGHDTMATVGIDARGDVAGGVTTSGTAFKLPGRVGDSAIVGAGIYVDQHVGGAAATGVGEEAMRVCATFSVVELMRRGEEPSNACRQTLERLIAANPALGQKQLGLAALRVDGVGGGASLRPGFAYALYDGEANRLVEVPAIGGTA